MPEAIDSRCCNCGYQHSGAASPNCFFSLSLNGIDTLDLTSTANPGKHILTIPNDPWSRDELRNEIWKQYQDIKEDAVAAARSDIAKGELKARKPIPSLAWRSVDEKKGRTESEDNFRATWERHVETIVRAHRGKRPFYISSPLLDVPAFDGSSDEDDSEAEEDRRAALIKVSESHPRHVPKRASRLEEWLQTSVPSQGFTNEVYKNVWEPRM